MSKFLIVYNICEISKTNLDWYIKCLDNLLKINYKKFHILVSGCRVSKNTKIELYNRYKNKISFYYTEHYLPVNITFNKAVLEAVKNYGEFDGYIYIDSGVDIEDKTDILLQINERFKTQEYGMVSIQTENDHGHWWFLSEEQLKKDEYIRDNDFIIPIGKCVHLHFQCFHNNLLKEFGKILPDIFVAYCTESTLSFLNAAIKKRWIHLKDIILSHKKSTDGATCCFDEGLWGSKIGRPIGAHRGPRGLEWNNLYGGYDINNILSNPEASETGFGYEELNKILIHDNTKFTPEGYALSNKLLPFLKNNLFLSHDQLDYDFIKDKFINIVK